MEISKGKCVRALVTNMKKRWTNTKVCFYGNMQRKICQSSCHEYEGVWVVREGEGEDLAWRTNLNFGFVLFLVQKFNRKLRTFTLSKILLVFHFGQKDLLSKIQSRKNGYLKEMALPNLIVPKFSAKLFPGFKVFLATHITKKIFWGHVFWLRSF